MSPSPSDPLRELLGSLVGESHKRCVHCRKPLTMPYHCATCGGTVAQDIPEEEFTIDLRVVHNPTGEMLSFHENINMIAKDGLADVPIDRLLRPLQRRLNKLIDAYVALHEEFAAAQEVPEDLTPAQKAEYAANVEALRLRTIRMEMGRLRDRIRQHRDGLKTVSGDNLPSAKDVLDHARKLRAAADVDDKWG